MFRVKLQSGWANFARYKLYRRKDQGTSLISFRDQSLTNQTDVEYLVETMRFDRFDSAELILWNLWQRV